ncbi:hypothetical protein GCM10009733_010790 [Nonomuraea maheshkhaliensis]|uniref:Uncharacterized protein n=1 Tax=Nonomuraea maheshkhaliensis TaxID=419590 RepID=A0ABP4QNA8_9ACTN
MLVLVVDQDQELAVRVVEGIHGLRSSVRQALPNLIGKSRSVKEEPDLEGCDTRWGCRTLRHGVYVKPGPAPGPFTGAEPERYDG